jgi:hypothetical protein
MNRRVRFSAAALGAVVSSGVAVLVLQEPGSAVVPQVRPEEIGVPLKCAAGEPEFRLIPQLAAGSKGQEKPEQALAQLVERAYPRLAVDRLRREDLPSGTRRLTLPAASGGTSMVITLQQGEGWFVTGFRACDSATKAAIR